MKTNQVRNGGPLAGDSLRNDVLRESKFVHHALIRAGHFHRIEVFALKILHEREQNRFLITAVPNRRLESSPFRPLWPHASDVLPKSTRICRRLCASPAPVEVIRFALKMRPVPPIPEAKMFAEADIDSEQWLRRAMLNLRQLGHRRRFAVGNNASSPLPSALFSMAEKLLC